MEGAPKYISFEDQFILFAMAKSTYLHVSPEIAYDIDSVGGFALLEKVLSTGRCRWGGLDGVVLSMGDKISGSLSWQMLSNGNQKIICNIDTNFEVLK